MLSGNPSQIFLYGLINDFAIDKIFWELCLGLSSSGTCVCHHKFGRGPSERGSAIFKIPNE